MRGTAGAAGGDELMRRIDVGDVALNVLDAGSGPPVLLIHGFPDDHRVWRRQIPSLLAAGWRVVAPDTRGCGQSDIAPKVSDYALPRLLDDLEAVLDALGIGAARVVGHDWGAAIAWALAIERPNRVERLAALSVGHPTAYANGPIEQKLKGYYIGIFQLRGLAEWLLEMGDFALFRRLMGSAAAETLIENYRRPGRLTAGLNYYRANLGLLFQRRRESVRSPVMGVFSDGDPFLAEAQMRKTAEFVSGPFRYELIRGVGHWLQLEAPEQLNALLLDFLKQEFR